MLVKTPQDPTSPAQGWRRQRGRQSLSEVFGTIATRPTGSLFKKLVAFLGPGYLVAVGYMDPGNWATALAGGSKFGYVLLPMAVLSSIMATCRQQGEMFLDLARQLWQGGTPQAIPIVPVEPRAASA